MNIIKVIHDVQQRNKPTRSMEALIMKFTLDNIKAVIAAYAPDAYQSGRRAAHSIPKMIDNAFPEFWFNGLDPNSEEGMVIREAWRQLNDEKGPGMLVYEE